MTDINELEDIKHEIELFSYMDTDNENIINTSYVATVFSEFSGKLKDINKDMLQNDTVADLYNDVLSRVEILSCLSLNENDVIKTYLIANECSIICGKLDKILTLFEL